MRKYIFVLLALFFVAPSISLASIDANLKYGSRGMEVTELQEFLIDKGFLLGQASGNFFSLTRKAVIAWQASVGLPATGFVGSMSRAKINAELTQDNTSSVSAEAAESSAAPTQSITANSLVSGCTSTTGFSVTTGKPCSVNVVTSNTTVNKTITFPNGSIAEIDSKGDIVRWVKEVVFTNSPSEQSVQNQSASVANTVTQQVVTPSTVRENTLPRVVVSPGRADSRHGSAINPGTKDYILSEIEISSDKKIFLNSIAWYSAGSEASFWGKYDNGNPIFPNFGTYINGIKYDTISSDGGKYGTAYLGGIVINAGEKKTISLKTDFPNQYLDAGRSIDFDIRKASNINIIDETGKVVTPNAESSLCNPSPEGMVCNNSTPWYNGRRVEGAPQPSQVSSSPVVTYSDYDFNYQWVAQNGLNVLSCPMTPRSIVIKKAVFEIPASELQKINMLRESEADGFTVALQTSPAPSMHSRRANMSILGTYNFEEKSPNTFVYFGGDIPICGDGVVATIGNVNGTVTDITSQGRNVKAYIDQKGIAVEAWDIPGNTFADAGFAIRLSPVMSEWEIWDNTTNKPVKIK